MNVHNYYIYHIHIYIHSDIKKIKISQHANIKKNSFSKRKASYTAFPPPWPRYPTQCECQSHRPGGWKTIPEKSGGWKTAILSFMGPKRPIFNGVFG